MSRTEKFVVLFTEKTNGALWGIVGYRAFQRGSALGVVLCIGAAAAFTYWRTNRFSIRWEVS